MSKNNKTARDGRDGGMMPVILGVLIIVAVVGAVLAISFLTGKGKETTQVEKHEETKKRQAVEAADDGKLEDYEKSGLVTLTDYKSFAKSYKKPEDNEEDLRDALWDDYLETCQVKEYPENLVEEALADTIMQYEGFAEVTGVTYDELLESYGMDESMVEDVAKDTIRGRLVASTIATRERLNADDATLEKYLMKLMDYDKSDFSSMEQLKKDYLEGYSVRPVDDVYVEMVKDYLTDLRK